jgi:hypothetical protein
VAGIGSYALSDSGELAQGIVFGVSGRPERVRELFAVKFNSTRYLWDYFKYPNPDKPEITNYKHQITISKSQI